MVAADVPPLLVQAFTCGIFVGLGWAWLYDSLMRAVEARNDRLRVTAPLSVIEYR